MSLFGINTIIYITRDSISFLLRGKVEAVNFAIPKGVEKNLEIVDEKNLEQSLNSFVSENGVKTKKCILLMGENVTFQKTTSAKKPEEQERRIKMFLEEIPYDQANIVHKRFYKEEGITTVVINSGYIKPILKVLDKIGFNIRFVVPEIIYQKGNFTPEKVSGVLNNLSLAKKSDFLEIIEKKDRNAKKIPLIILETFLGLITISLLGWFIFQYFTQKPHVPKAKEPAIETVQNQDIVDFTEGLEESTESTEEVIEESATTDINRDEVSILILNGTGLPGLAGSTAETLNEMGFTDTEIGNADNTGNIPTTLEYNEQTPQQYVEEITNQLKNTFSEVTAINGDNEYNIVVTTGLLTN